ncbi:MAG: efflux RND transporter permease subunit, partial [Mesorhizobium sp.]
SAILGVLPIAFGLGLEIFHHETTINAPSTQWWISLSSAIVFGLSFATLLTLVVTPSMLMVFTRAKVKPGARRGWFGRLFRRGKGELSTGEPVAQANAEPAVAFPKAAE